MRKNKSKLLTLLTVWILIISVTLPYLRNLYSQNKDENNFHSEYSSLPMIWMREYISDQNIKQSIDLVEAITVDLDGNIYVTGTSNIINESEDIITIKYNSTGNQEWMVRFNGIGNNIDKAKGIAVDKKGNAYVCGISRVSKFNYDFVVIKYDYLGNKKWDVYFNGPSNDYDEPTDIKLDNLGNIYVTGASYSKLHSYNFATVKYDSNGNIKWAIIYDGPKNDYDYPTALAIDNVNNVIVTGFSMGLSSNFDCTTIKYNSNGKEIWISRYNGSFNGDDFGEYLTLDRTGNIYVSGTSEINEDKYNIFSLKLDSDGNLIWDRVYNNPFSDNDGPSGIVCDRLGNIIVTGRSYSESELYNITTIKYNSEGEQLWASTYDGQGFHDEPSSIAVDNFNNIYVTGMSISHNTSKDIVTIKYDQFGLQQWVNNFNGSNNDEPTGIVVDNFGNCYIGGFSVNDFFLEDYLILKYTTSGIQDWCIIQDIFREGIAFVTDFVIDKLGNIYVTGKNYDPKSKFFDYLTIKYNQSGEILWLSKYEDSNDTSDYKSSITIDSMQNVYIAGIAYSAETLYDYIIIKYNQNGEMEWINRYNSPDNNNDIPIDISTDRSGNIYVTGYSYNPLRSFDYTTLKYNSNGALLWKRSYNGLANKEDVPVCMLVDHYGNAYIVGKSKGIDSSYDITVVKYFWNGETDYVAKYIGTPYKDDIPIAADLGRNNYLYVTGMTHSDLKGYDYLTIKFSANGTILWVKKYNGTGNRDDIPSDIIADKFGNVYVTGKSLGVNSDYDFLTIKYNSFGEEEWVVRYNGLTNQYDEPRSLILDSRDNLYVAGLNLNGASFMCVILVYNKFGYFMGKTTYNELGSIKVEPIKIMSDPFNDLVLCANVSSFENLKFSTIKYKSFLTGVLPQQESTSRTISVFPNPFNDKVTIKYNFPMIEEVHLDVLDVNGRIVKRLLDKFKNSGTNIVLWDGTDDNLQRVSSGVYFIRIRTKEFLEIRKILLIK